MSQKGPFFDVQGKKSAERQNGRSADLLCRAVMPAALKLFGLAGND